MSKLSGTVEKVFDRSKGTSKSTGRPWSVQRFKLDAGDGEEVTCEAWGMRDLEDLEGEEVTVTGKLVKETYEGKTYEKFKLDGPVKRAGFSKGDEDEDEPPRRQARREDPDDEPAPPKEDTWKVHLMRCANLLAKCHEAAQSVGLTDGEDARSLFIHMPKKYIKDLPAKPMVDVEEDLQPLPSGPSEPGQDYGEGPEDDEVPF